ncbi:hypothetical protein LA76x_2563 [Lysobacter antibioticus]|uniref:Uncharacterized protein n=1 Tax=Lysobacter antibioticus TaxID=84531 RepID=A0A0S2FAW8_LYSAN|nr:hypothetical protein LA76x_2563 [Lysobacter antibioticus]
MFAISSLGSLRARHPRAGGDDGVKAHGQAQRPRPRAALPRRARGT